MTRANLGIFVLSHDEGMDVLDRDSPFGGQQESLSGRVEHRSNPKNSPLNDAPAARIAA
ncbi:hypothetical protein HG717_15845 [Rhodococcus erythropolis]|uniref:hypothetical protein n=1 Tax=Rhodococcus erythropolis TaxID=1833 RepID=UPI001DE70288|nr:hypothetical protein [Rhodococcus erythropolis]MBY6385374.1 hypothetical protein [Rhodococcus erythropolis]